MAAFVIFINYNLNYNLITTVQFSLRLPCRGIRPFRILPTASSNPSQVFIYYFGSIRV